MCWGFRGGKGLVGLVRSGYLITGRHGKRRSRDAKQKRGIRNEGRTEERKESREKNFSCQILTAWF